MWPAHTGSSRPGPVPQNSVALAPSRAEMTLKWEYPDTRHKSQSEELFEANAHIGVTLELLRHRFFPLTPTPNTEDRIQGLKTVRQYYAQPCLSLFETGSL